MVGGRHQAIAAAALVMKLGVWCLIGLSAIVLLLFLFRVAPLMMLPKGDTLQDLLEPEVPADVIQQLSAVPLVHQYCQ